jgi:hypothetical protein
MDLFDPLGARHERAEGDFAEARAAINAHGAAVAQS